MNFRYVFLSSCLLFASLAAAEETISPEELEPGDRGWGLSVFRGDEPERFEVEVLGVLGNFRAGTDYILARLEGHDLERSGVVAGMSGSPVYFDDKLAGAVAWSWSFSQDAIAGITPIAAMREIPRGGDSLASFSAGEVLSTAQLAGLEVPEDLLEQALAALRAPDMGEASAAPLWAVSGFGDSSRAFLSTALQAGIAPSGSRLGGGVGNLVAGSAVAGVLVDGDLRLAVTGTVTERQGDEILAFGHPFLGQGSLRLPMATAEIITVVPSRFSSFKVSNTGDIVGAFLEDRAVGVRGLLGAEANMVPLTVRISGERQSEMHMRVAELPALAPTLMATSVLGALDSVDRASGPQGLDLEATWKIADREPLSIRQSFDGETAAFSAINYFLAVNAFLMNNSLEAVRIEEVEVLIETFPVPRTLTLVAGHADRTRLRPGESVNVSLDLVAWRGEPLRETVTVDLPAELPAGTYFLLVGDGVSIDVARLTVEKRQPIRFDQALDMLRSFHSRKDLVALGLFADSGLAVAGEAMPRLPGSIRSIWSASASKSAEPLVLAVGQEEIQSMDRPVEGAVRIDLEILRREPSKGSEGKNSTNGKSSTETSK
jgi:hypothetical protein